VKVTQAVIPAAGLGTRFLPVTKAVPKEMLPILDKPSIHYIVAEGVASGIEHFCIVCSPGRTATEEYFRPDPKLAAALARAGKASWTESIDELIASARFSFIYQNEPRGLADAVLCARDCIGDDDFAVMLPDDLLLGDVPGLAQLANVAKEHGTGAIALVRVASEKISAYGVVSVVEELPGGIVRMDDIVEKPNAADAPSDLAIIGRYIFPRQLMEVIADTPAGKAGEVQLTDAIVRLMQSGTNIAGYLVDGPRFDAGTPVGWLQANNYLASYDPRYAGTLASI